MARRREVALERRKGIWTHGEVAALFQACHVPPPAGVKGVWTLDEVVAGLKTEGFRVWGTELSGPVYELGRPQGGEP